MATMSELKEFQKMWTWLSSHPAHDQEYYMRHVARLDIPWKHGCPLCHTSEEPCRNCETLWQSMSGGLCSDQDSPLNRWRRTSTDDPDNRSWYANRVALLGQKAMREQRA